MTPSAGNVFFTGETALYAGSSGGYIILVFEARSGSIHVPKGPSTNFPPFSKAIKKWWIGPGRMEDVPNSSGEQTLSSDAGVDT